MRQVVNSQNSAGHGTVIAGGWREPAQRPSDVAARTGIGPEPAESPDLLLERRVRSAIEQSHSNRRTVAIIMVDLDTSDVEDRRETEVLLRTRLRRYDLVVGLEGSLIAICLGHLRNLGELAGVAERVDEIIAAERFRRTWGSPRIGTAIHASGGTAPQLVAAARAALASPGRA